MAHTASEDKHHLSVPLFNYCTGTLRGSWSRKDLEGFSSLGLSVEHVVIMIPVKDRKFMVSRKL